MVAWQPVGGVEVSLREDDSLEGYIRLLETRVFVL